MQRPRRVCWQQVRADTMPVALVRWTWRLTPVLARRYGHRRVQDLLRHEPLPPSMAPCDPLCFQVSSMASIQPKRLAGLKASFGAHAPVTGTAEQQPDPQSDAEAPEVQFVYPTVAQVRDCIEGWFAGTSAAILRGARQGPCLYGPWALMAVALPQVCRCRVAALV